MKKHETSLTIESYLNEYSAITNKSFLGSHQERYAFMASLISDSDIVLDVGCGEGFGTKILSEKAMKVFGVDYHPQVVEYAKKMYTDDSGKLVFKEGDCYRLDFEDGFFDMICAFDLIEHLTDEDLFLEKLHRLLRKGGKLVLSTPNKLIHLIQLGNIYEFHHKEYFHNEFTNLISSHFDDMDVYAQNPIELYDVIKTKNLLFRRISSLAPTHLKKIIKKAIHRFSGRHVMESKASNPVLLVDENARELITCSDFIIVATKK